MKKRAVSLLLTILTAVSLILPASAGSSWSAIRLDGEAVQGVDYEIRNGVCFVTVASFAVYMDPEAMVDEEGGRVSVSASRVKKVVDAAAGASVVTENLTLTAKNGDSYLEANGRCLYVKDGVTTIDGKVAVPIRVLGEVYNLDVGYDNVACSVILVRRKWPNAYLTPGDDYYNSGDLLWLSRIINAESGNQSLKGKIAVGNVVINRVRSSLFPNTIYNVLFQKNQFSPAISGSIYKTPSADSVRAAKLVIEGVTVVPTALFFNQAGSTTYAARSRTYVTTIGGHAFYA